MINCLFAVICWRTNADCGSPPPQGCSFVRHILVDVLYTNCWCADPGHHDSRPADARSSSLTPPVTMSPLPGITRESRRLTIGLSSNSRISSVPRQKRYRLNRWPGAGVRGVETWSWWLVSRTLTGPVNLAGAADRARALGPLLNNRKIFFFLSLLFFLSRESYFY